MKIDEVTNNAAIVFRPKGWQAASDVVDALSRAGCLYRGMTAQEYQKTVGRGAGVASTGDYSLQGEGTNFSVDAASAESYINYGRDDPRRTGRPTYLIEIRAGDNLQLGRDGYYKAAMPIPQSQITRIWEMRPEDGAINGYQIYPQHMSEATLPRVSDEVLQYIQTVLSELQSRYPAVRNFITSIQFPNRVTSEYDLFSRELRISNAGLSGSLADADRWQEHANKPGFMVGNTLRSLILHEFGHAIDHYIIDHSDEAGKTAWFERKRQLERQLGPVSGYARTNTREWFAEQFVAEYERQKPAILLEVIDEFMIADQYRRYT